MDEKAVADLVRLERNRLFESKRWFDKDIAGLERRLAETRSDRDLTVQTISEMNAWLIRNGEPLEIEEPDTAAVA